MTQLGFGSASFLSPCRLWFADNGHINFRGGPSDVDSLALSDRGLRVTRRNVYDSTIVRRRRIVLALGGERRDAKGNNKCGDEKKLRHLAARPFFIVELINPNISYVFLASASVEWSKR